MTIYEITKQVKAYPKHDIIFYREGNFCKCYNFHAMYFTENIKKMKVHTRFYKNIKSYVHSMGFPYSVLDKYIEQFKNKYGATVAETTDDYIRLTGIHWEATIHYQAWREEHIRVVEEKEEAKKKEEHSRMLLAQEPVSAAYSVENPQVQRLLHALKSYSLESATPIEALNFLHKIKKMAYECTASETI